MPGSSGVFLIAAALLAVSGLLKTIGPRPTIVALRSAGVPQAAVVGVLLGPAEVAVGLWALMTASPPAAAATAAFFAGFLLFILRLRRRNAEAPCGCFGAAGSPPGRAHVVTDVGAAAAAGAAVFVPAESLPALISGDASTGLTTVVLLVTGIYAIRLLLAGAPMRRAQQADFTLTGAVTAGEGMEERIALGGASLLGGRPDRRTFLTRTALAGTALLVAPMRFILRPGTAYAAICDCSGQDCACGSLCCDGYTEFCCTIYGDNSCPPGSVAAGWWKVDASSFCTIDGVAQPRYYVDCNAVCEADCGPSGFCDGAGASCECGCANGSCDNRKACCTKFRYGQCNQDMECIGPIVCRVVTCVPPWVWDTSCHTTEATDNNTRWHDAACLHVGGSEPSAASPVPGGVPLVGDWDGDGVTTPGMFVDGRWYLTNRPGSRLAEIVFQFGQPGDIPVVGDWFGDGHDSVGVVRGGRWFLSRRLQTGIAEREFSFGLPGDIPVVGDWDGDGRDGIGVVRAGRWYLSNGLGTRVADYDFEFGLPDDIPVVGDWSGSGADAPGVVRGAVWHLAGAPRTAVADVAFEFGIPGDIPVVGDWDQDGIDGPGVVRGATWYLRNAAGHGPGDVELVYGTNSNHPATGQRTP